MPLDVSLVQPESEFVNVAKQVLFARVMIDAVQSAFQDGPGALDRVGRYRTPSVPSKCVVDRVVTVKQSVKVRENHVIVGIKLASDFDVGVNLAVDRIQRANLGDLRACSSATFTHSEYGHFADRSTASMKFIRLVLVSFESTNEALVDFDFAPQFVEWSIGATASFPQSAQHEP